MCEALEVLMVLAEQAGKALPHQGQSAFPINFPARFLDQLQAKLRQADAQKTQVTKMRRGGSALALEIIHCFGRRFRGSCEEVSSSHKMR
jgi:hypothetical protein